MISIFNFILVTIPFHSNLNFTLYFGYGRHLIAYFVVWTGAIVMVGPVLNPYIIFSYIAIFLFSVDLPKIKFKYLQVIVISFAVVLIFYVSDLTLATNNVSLWGRLSGWAREPSFFFEFLLALFLVIYRSRGLKNIYSPIVLILIILTQSKSVFIYLLLIMIFYFLCIRKSLWFALISFAFATWVAVFLNAEYSHLFGSWRAPSNAAAMIEWSDTPSLLSFSVDFSSVMNGYGFDYTPGVFSLIPAAVYYIPDLSLKIFFVLLIFWIFIQKLISLKSSCLTRKDFVIDCCSLFYSSFVSPKWLIVVGLTTAVRRS